VVFSLADERIEAFLNRFGQPHLDFAMHAAFPLAITPDLLYRLWATFVVDECGDRMAMPWVAVADVLLAGFVSEVRRETFQMDKEVQHAPGHPLVP
jgi:hypothetical protein